MRLLALAIVAFIAPTASGEPLTAADAACLVGADSEVNSSWPSRAAAVVCDTLRRHGEHVARLTETPLVYSAAYVTSVRRIGSEWLVTIGYEAPVGTRRSERRTTLRAIADVESAAAVLAAAPYANTPVPPPPVLPPPRDALILDGWLGGSSAPAVNGGHDGSFVLGFNGLFRHDWLEAGLALGAGTELFGPGFVSGTVLAGVAFNPAPWFQVDLLGEFGVESISGLGGGLFDSVEEGGNVMLPYFGGRAGLSLLLGRSHRFLLGWWFAPGFSERAIVHSTVQSCFLGCDTTSETFDVGGFVFASGLRIGGVVGLGG